MNCLLCMPFIQTSCLIVTQYQVYLTSTICLYFCTEHIIIIPPSVAEQSTQNEALYLVMGHCRNK